MIVLTVYEIFEKQFSFFRFTKGMYHLKFEEIRLEI